MKPTDPSLLWSSTRCAMVLHPPVVHRLGQLAALLEGDALPAGAELVDAGVDAPLLDHGGDARSGHAQDEGPSHGLEERPAVFLVVLHRGHNNNTLSFNPGLR